MKPDAISTACSYIVVACATTCIVMAMFRVECRPMVGIAIGVGTVAAIIGARQPA